LDPHRIQPFAHPPPAVGNSQQAPPQAFGIQVQGNHGQYHPGYPPAGYPPPGNGYWPDPRGYFYDPASYPGAPPLRRDEATNARRLSDRITGYADIPANAGLPPKPTPAALDSALSSGNGNQRKGRGGQSGGAPPLPPPDAKEDPRAAAGRRVSYHDMDLVAEVRTSPCEFLLYNTDHLCFRGMSNCRTKRLCGPSLECLGFIEVKLCSHEHEVVSTNNHYHYIRSACNRTGALL